MDQYTSKFSEPKIIVTVSMAMVVLVNLVTSAAILQGLAVLTLIILGSMKYLKDTRLAGLLPIVFMGLMVSSIQLLTIGQQVVYTFTIFGRDINICSEGMVKGVTTFLRIFSSAGITLIMVSLVKLEQFVAVLRWFRLPSAFIEVIILSIKFIFIFKEDMQSLRYAQRTRLGYGSAGRALYSISSIAGVVLTRAYDRSKVLARSMKTRGYDGKKIL